jgi:hypothetical protein
MMAMASHHEILEEQMLMLKLRVLFDLTAYRLQTSAMDRSAGLELIARTRALASEICPGKESVFDLVLSPRFLRILDERALAEWGVADAVN